MTSRHVSPEQVKAPRRLALALLLGALAICTTAAPSETSLQVVDKRGTQLAPLVIQQAAAAPSAEDLRREAVHVSERAEDIAYRAKVDIDRRSMDRWTIAVGVATVLILVVQAIAFFVQAREMRQSVEEMKSSTKVAQTAAESAKTSADAAVNANNLGREALLAEHRPWIKFVVTPLSLRYGRDGWELKLSYELLNIGTAPALNAVFRAEMMPHVLSAWRAESLADVNTEDMLAQATNVGGELQRFSRQGAEAARTSPVFGGLVFPQDRQGGSFTIYRSDSAFLEGIGRRGYSGQLLLLIGVTYKSAVDQSWHQTAVAFSLYLVEGQTRARIALVGGKFEAVMGQLALQQQPLADSYAT